MTNLAPQWLTPDITTYKVKEVATGYACFSANLGDGSLISQTRQLAGWTALQYPWKWCNEGGERYMSEENRALALSHDMRPLVKGMDTVVVE
jgi:hypothetical protein